MFSLEWHGEEFKRKVLGISEKIIKDSSKRVQRNAKSFVKKRSGKLAASIKTKTWEKNGSVGAIIEAGVKGEEHVASFVELGTPGKIYISGKRKGKKRTPIKEGAYLRPALKREKSRLLRSFANKL